MSNLPGWHRRQAIQLAAQLPEDPRDALRVLELAKTLVLDFLGGGDGPHPVLVLTSADRSRVASETLKASSRPK